MQFVEPIRGKCEIHEVKRILGKKSKRDLLLFSLGINSGLRISDILKLKVKDVQHVDFIEIKEQKTQKYKRFPVSYAYKRLSNIYSKFDNWIHKELLKRLIIVILCFHHIHTQKLAATLLL